MKKVIFHIDVNSAFLSWEALRLLEEGSSTDLRNVPSAVGGDRTRRHGIVLAKSTPAKKYGIETAEPIAQALKKCPDLIVVPPHFDFYTKCSKAFIEILKRYSPVVEQFSIDEAFCDMSGTEGIYGDLVEFAHKLKSVIYEELGFTVNIGISTNRLLAKMASDFQKPYMVHTLFPEEIEKKLWPLPVKELLYVGKSSAKKLDNLGIRTIGELAKTDINILKLHFKKQGEIFHCYANGIDNDSLNLAPPQVKGYSNSLTLPIDVTDRETAHKILLSLCETTSSRIRADKATIMVVGVTITDYQFNTTSKQCSLFSPTNVTGEIYSNVVKLFDELWIGAPIRLLGVSTSKATNDEYSQYDLFDTNKHEKLRNLDSAIDKIRDKYGKNMIQRASLIDKETKEFIKHPKSN